MSSSGTAVPDVVEDRRCDWMRILLAHRGVATTPLHARRVHVQKAGGSGPLAELPGPMLAGEADQVALDGIDRWIGGNHLTGPGPR